MAIEGSRWLDFPETLAIRKRPCMGGSSSKAKEAKEKEKEKEKGAKEKGAASQQQHRVTPVAKRPPDATARSTPQPSPRQAASAPAAALPAGSPSTLDSAARPNNSLLQEFSNEAAVELQLNESSHPESSADLEAIAKEVLGTPASPGSASSARSSRLSYGSASSAASADSSAGYSPSSAASPQPWL